MNSMKRFVACEASLVSTDGDTEIRINGFVPKKIKVESEEWTTTQVPGIDPDESGSKSDECFPVPNIVGEENGVMMLHMDIREPLGTLRSLLEEKLQKDLSDYVFCLQDSQLLEPNKNLVDQCIQGEGLVQIDVQLKEVNLEKRINIVDVLKPAEEYVEIGDGDLTAGLDQEEVATIPSPSNVDKVVRWSVDASFKKEQARLKIPEDPGEWDVAHVRHWLQWAVRKFNLTKIKLSDWNFTGKQLCEMGIETFRRIVPHDPGNVFWTHTELLRKCKIIAVKSRTPPVIKRETEDPSESVDCLLGDETTKPSTSEEKFTKVSSVTNSGQIQLWQFLLELLTDKNHRNAIQWLGDEGEFKLINPELVAKLWGARKNKPKMNYEKVSRALRYYYDGDMIAKVHGKRFVYKFVCDLKHLLGYSASELNALVIEAEERARASGKLDFAEVHF